ncbi:phosducin-like protein [Styela clava]
MALNNMDDKLLGEKVDYYCSSSEDEGNSASGDEGSSDAQESIRSSTKAPTFIPESRFDGKATQTGPKGVIEDWRRYKQLETEKRERDIMEKDELCRKLAMTCKSFKEEENDKKQAGKDEFDLSDDEDFMEYYKKKRIIEMQEMVAKKWSKIVFGDVIELNRDNFVDAIEKEDKHVTVIIHIFDDDTPACATVHGCMRILASKYKTVKFCRINTGEARLSSNFLENGLPTIIVYKENLVIGNFVRISDTLGNDFYANDLETFLCEYGMLPHSHEHADVVL